MKYMYDYPKPSVSADCVIFGFDGTDLSVLLIERGQEPFKGRWTFPGGFMNMDETTLQCAARELKEETGLNGMPLEQLGAFSSVDRDPRERVITVAYFSVVRISENDPVAGDDAANASWFRIADVPLLAFDHDLVLRTAIGKLKDGFKSESNFPALAGDTFSLSEVRKLRSVVESLNYDPYKPE
jgi:8-oxo-dGTP diphosphatase